MDLRLATIADRLRELAYRIEGHVVVDDPVLGLTELEPFDLDSFGGLVASTPGGVFVAFRGSSLDISDLDAFERTVRNWITNLQFGQIERKGYRVHKGFLGELEPSLGRLRTMVDDLGGREKPVRLTGHSAGGALATLTGQLWSEEGHKVEEVLVVSSPRVGDRRFAERYPVPLIRIEHGSDLVPHVPFSSFFATRLGETMLGAFRERIEGWTGRTAESLMRDTEGYVHAGQLFYDRDDEVAFRITSGRYWQTAGTAILDQVEAFFTGEEVDEASHLRALNCPPWALPLPASVMDASRIMTTAQDVIAQIDKGRFDFVRVDHHVSRTGGLLRRLGGVLSGPTG